MNTKQLTCMDEELLIQITKPAAEIESHVIVISFTRTYQFTDPTKAHEDSGDLKTCEVVSL